jgi:hypothetical protein
MLGCVFLPKKEHFFASVLHYSVRTILDQMIKFNSENGFTTWRKLDPHIQRHKNNPAPRSEFLAQKELERRLNKSGLFHDHLQQQIAKAAKRGGKFLNISLQHFRLLLNRICPFEDIISHWLVNPIEEFFCFIKVCGKI